MKYIVFDHDGTLVDTSGPKYKLFPGMRELLVELAKTCQLYVWTARGRSSTLRILDDLGVLNLFDGVSTPDDAPNKPHDGGLIYLLGGVPKNSICVIGDSTNDILGAKRFGVKSLGATWNGAGAAGVLLDAGADFIVSQPSECYRIIELNLMEDSDV